MKSRLLIIITLAISYLSISAQIIDVAAFDTLATELDVPECQSITSFAGKGFHNLRRISFNGIEYLPPSSFRALPNLEEVIFNGDNLVIGGAQFFDLPKLKRVVFNGNNFLMNGSTMVGRSPCFEIFEINGLVTLSEMWDPAECPLFKNYSGDFSMLYNGNSKLINSASPTEIAHNKILVDVFSRQLNRVTEIFEKCDSNLRLASQFMYFHPYIVEYAKAFNVDTTAYIVARNKARENEYFWSYADILRHSPEYATDSLNFTFCYAMPDDSLLRDLRIRFNFDSIAGCGNDISRIKNLTYWVHNNIPHDGSSYNPEGMWTLSEIFDTCKVGMRGVNCRMLAIALTEALLSEGIPARYLTCQSKKWDSDEDCHVICTAWSSSLNKWVWCDPTFAAFITDENGCMLHPGEVRERIVNNLPIFINEDANWNNQELYSKEEYIDGYMAKNLYYITANLNNKAAPEGYLYDQESIYVTLAPIVNNFRGSQFITTDPSKFWATP